MELIFTPEAISGKFRMASNVTPIKAGHTYRKQITVRFRALVAKALTSAIIAGVGIGYLATENSTGQTNIATFWNQASQSPLFGLTLPQFPIYFEYCSQARNAGMAPIYRGQPGYRLGLDADRDGIACEPVSVEDAHISDYGVRHSTRRLRSFIRH